MPWSFVPALPTTTTHVNDESYGQFRAYRVGSLVRCRPTLSRADDNHRKRGNVTWGGGQPPPPPPSPAPPPVPPAPPIPAPPAVCGKLLLDTGVGEFDIGDAKASSVDGCCALCSHNPRCKIWAWHAEQGGVCHMHTAQGEINHHPGCYAGVMNRTAAWMSRIP